MKTMILIFIFAAVINCSPPICPSYICDYNFNDNETSCYEREINSTGYWNRLHQCKLEEKMYCSFNASLDERNVCDMGYALLGEYCNDSISCIRGNCTRKHFCEYDDDDHITCSSHDDCSPGHYCDLHDKKCVVTADYGKNCSNEVRCRVEALCDKGVCTKLASIDNGQPANVVSLCKSFYMEGGICKEGSKFTGARKYFPDEDGLCHYQKADGVNYTESSICGVTNDSKPVCRPAEGDADMSHVKIILFDLFSSSLNI